MYEDENDGFEVKEKDWWFDLVEDRDYLIIFSAYTEKFDYHVEQIKMQLRIGIEMQIELRMKIGVSKAECFPQYMSIESEQFIKTLTS